MKKNIRISLKRGIYFPLALLACCAPAVHAAAIQTATKPVESEQATTEENASPETADAASEQTEPDTTPQSVEEQILQVKSDFKTAMTEWMVEYKAAKTRAARSKALGNNPRLTFPAKFLELYEANVDDAAALPALREAILLSGRKGNSKATKLMFEQIAEQESQAAKATNVAINHCMLLIKAGAPRAQAKAAAKLIELSKQESDDGLATKMLLPLAEMRMRSPAPFQKTAVDLIWERIKSEPESAGFATLAAVGFNGSPEASSAACSAILEHHSDHEDFAEALTNVPTSANPGYEALVKQAAKNGEGDLQAQAAVSLAKYIPNRDRRLDRLSLNEEELAALDKENKELMELLRTFDGDSKLHKQAQSELFELEHLSPGAEAMDIVGTDLNGSELRLSDYRGKVVFLDFWGDW